MILDHFKPLAVDPRDRIAKVQNTSPSSQGMHCDELHPGTYKVKNLFKGTSFTFKFERFDRQAFRDDVLKKTYGNEESTKRFMSDFNSGLSRGLESINSIATRKVREVDLMLIQSGSTRELAVRFPTPQGPMVARIPLGTLKIKTFGPIFHRVMKSDHRGFILGRGSHSIDYLKYYFDYHGDHALEFHQQAC